MRQLLAAQSGWGKSWLAQAVAETNIPRFDRTLVADYKDEYRGLVKGGLSKALIVGEQEAQLSQEGWASVLETNPHLCLIRHNLRPETWRQALSNAIAALRNLSGSAWVLIDEAHFVVPQREGYPDALKGLATTGRGEQVSSTWVSQRLTEMDETVIAQRTQTLAGGFSSKRDRQKLAPEYPKEVHNPERSRPIPDLPEDLQAPDEGPIPLRSFGGEGQRKGSEWIRSGEGGNRSRVNSAEMNLTTTHHGPQGVPIKAPDAET